METRTITEVKLYVLRLNPVRGRFEDADIVAISGECDNLKRWYEEQFADSVYSEILPDSFDGQSRNFRLAFKEDSLLKYYNPAPSLEPGCVDYCGHGVNEEWVNIECLDELRNRYNFIE